MALVVTPVGAARTDVAAGAPPSSAGFRVGAATADFTPPPAGSIAHDPADCVAGTPLESVFSGPRRFAFEEPYVDQANVGHYVLGDPFADCNHDGRWDGNLLGGGASTPRFYDQVADPVTARALVVSNGGRTLAVEVLDQEGVFDVYQQRIRQKVAADGFRTDGIFISATHDESAPDTLGLGGVNSETSGTNPYFVDYMVDKGARAIEQAMAAMVPARIRCVGIEMAGSVGSVETPEVFSGAISRTPQRFQDASHPAGCRTLFDANGSLAALGYGAETMMLGQALAGSVESALDGSARWSTTYTLWGTRASVCIPLTNVLFAAAAALGVFSDRPPLGVPESLECTGSTTFRPDGPAWPCGCREAGSSSRRRGCRCPGGRRRRPTATPAAGSTREASATGWMCSPTWLAPARESPSGPLLLVDPVEETLHDPPGPPRDAPVLLPQGDGAGAEAPRQRRELVRLARQGVAGRAPHEVQPIASALTEAVGHGEHVGVGGVEHAGFFEGGEGGHRALRPDLVAELEELRRPLDVGEGALAQLEVELRVLARG
jgi:hypothetical protein